MASVLGIIMMILGRYLLFSFFGPWGMRDDEQLCSWVGMASKLEGRLARLSYPTLSNSSTHLINSGLQEELR